MFFLAGLRWTLGFKFTRGFIAIGCGRVSLGWSEQSLYWVPGPVYNPSKSWSESLACFWERGLVPSIDQVQVFGLVAIGCPIWILLVLIGVPTLWLWRRDSQPPGPVCCVECGYNLTGNTSGRCPECGTACCTDAGPSSPKG